MKIKNVKQEISKQFFLGTIQDSHKINATIMHCARKGIDFENKLAIWSNDIPNFYTNDLKIKENFNPAVHTQKSSNGKRLISSNLIHLSTLRAFW